jgi:hypothetical protein
VVELGLLEVSETLKYDPANTMIDAKLRKAGAFPWPPLSVLSRKSGENSPHWRTLCAAALLF